MKLKSTVKAYFWLLFGAGVVIALDQWTKSLVRQNIPLGGSWLPSSMAWLFPYARVVHWYNTGAAFGMFPQGSALFMALAFVIAGAILYFYPRTDPAEWWVRLAMTLQLGGAVGNLVDRLTVGKVTDFISMGTFAVFNVADSAITVGTGILLLGMWLTERDEGGQESESEDAEEPDSVSAEEHEDDG